MSIPKLLPNNQAAMNRLRVCYQPVVFSLILLCATSVFSTASAQIGRGGIIRRIRERAAARYEQVAEEARRIAEERIQQQKAAEKANAAQARQANERVESNRRRQQTRRLQEQQRQQIERARTSQSRAQQSRALAGSTSSNRADAQRRSDSTNRRELSTPSNQAGRTGGYRPLFPQGYRPLNNPAGNPSRLNDGGSLAERSAPGNSRSVLQGQRVRGATAGQSRFFGMELSDTRKYGVVVNSVQRGSVAEASGLKVGDEVRELAGMKISSAQIVNGLESAFRAGDQIGVVVARKGRTENLTIRVPAANATSGNLGSERSNRVIAEPIEAPPSSGILLGGSSGDLEDGGSGILLNGQSEIEAADRLREEMFRDFPKDDRTEEDYNQLLFGDNTKVGKAKVNNVEAVEPESIPVPKSRSASTSQRESSRKPALPEIPTVNEVNQKLDRLMELIESQQRIIEKQTRELKELKKNAPNRREF